PQTLDVVRGRAVPLGIDVRVTDVTPDAFDDQVFGALVQYPDDDGAVVDLRPIVNAAHGAGARVAVASDLLALTLLTPPGEMDADVVVGNSQRFGVPMGYGGPHAAFFATREAFVRQAPGRIIGVSIDAHGQRAYRMTLQTREQHIRREKATSNICTAQALLANIAAMYAVYHGPEGLTAIAQRVHAFALQLARALEAVGVRQLNAHYFDTLCLAATGLADRVRHRAVHAGLNFRYFDDGRIGIALDETTTEADLDAIVRVFADGARSDVARDGGDTAIPSGLQRASAFLTHPVFNTHRSEIEMMRYIRSLERKDIGLDTSMIPLGSCTMKLNAAAEMYPVTWPEFGRMHPYAPIEQARGYVELFGDLERWLAEITGYDAVSLQPNAGSQGEYA
ncbi:MAG: glycine dehydrogenase (aminomethyl-transferring), partial [Vicinamibacterales bacterium]